MIEKAKIEEERNKKPQEIKDNDLCRICMDNIKEYAFNNCGHKCVCEDCNLKLKKKSNCIICRTPGKTIKIYD